MARSVHAHLSVLNLSSVSLSQRERKDKHLRMRLTLFPHLDWKSNFNAFLGDSDIQTHPFKLTRASLGPSSSSPFVFFSLLSAPQSQLTVTAGWGQAPPDLWAPLRSVQ